SRRAHRGAGIGVSMSMLVVAAPMTCVASRQAARAPAAAPVLILVMRRILSPTGALQFPQLDASYRVIAPFLQNQVGALARRHHVLAQIGEVDRPPDRPGGLDRLLRSERGVAVEVGQRIPENRLPQLEKPLD